MLVNDYRVFVQSTQPRKTQPLSQKKQEEEKFSFQKYQPTISKPLKSTSSIPIDYISSKNYYANKFQLQTKQEQEQKALKQENKKDPLEYYQKISKLTKLPETYSIAFTTFYDLTKPKPALTQHSTSQATPKVYKEAKEQQTKQEVVTTYIANDLYYQRTSA